MFAAVYVYILIKLYLLRNLAYKPKANTVFMAFMAVILKLPLPWPQPFLAYISYYLYLFICWL